MVSKSKYIHECKIEDKIILIHTLTFSNFVIKGNDVGIWDSENYNEMNQSILSQLIEMNYLINDTNEDEKMLTLAQKYFSIPKPMSPNIVIYITNECNLRCSYCFTGYEQEKKYETISFKDVDKILASISYIYSINSFAKSGPIISLFGGEPLLLKNREIVEYIFERVSKMSVNVLEIVSNIVNIKSFVDIIKRYKNSVYVRVTLNGEKDIHDRLRKTINDKGTYDLTFKNMAFILENTRNVVFELAILLDKNGANVSGIEKLFEDLQKHDFLDNERVDVKFGKIQFREEYICPNYSNQVLDVEDYYPILLELKKNIPYIKHKMLAGSSMHKLLDIYNFWIYDIMITPSFKGCDAVYPGRYCFYPDGYIYPCSDVAGMEKYRSGEYRNKLELNGTFVAWKNFKTIDLLKCNQCKYVGFCNGGCLITSNCKNNDINDVYCENIKESLDKLVLKMYQEGIFNE